MYCLINWQKSLDMRRPIQTTTREIVKHFPFVLIALLFCIFVFLNGGIVLGDRNAHKPVLHLPQLFYFSSFILFTSLPILGSNIVKNNDRSPFYQIATHKFTSLLILIFSLVCVKYFTYSHPYLLADNRHFTFYLWRRWFMRNWFNKYLNTMVYLISFWHLYNSMKPPIFYKILFLFSTALTIVPAELLEIRYFIVPYAIWRINVYTRNQLVLCEIGMNLLVNFIVLYLFFERPFKWGNEPDAQQRFMW